MLQISCINHHKSKLPLPNDSHCIRASFLVGDSVLVAGTTFMAIDFENQWAAKPSAWLKKKMVLDYCSRMPDPKILKEAEQLFEIVYEDKHRIKHPPPQLIIARKKCEKALDQLYESSKQELRNVYSKIGFTGLTCLVDEGFISLWGSSSEQPEFTGDGAVAYSEILSNKWTKQDELYCFTTPFWEFAQQQNIVVSSYDEADTNTSMLTFRLFHLPPLGAFTATELKAIRQEIFCDMQPFREAVSDWSAQLKAEDFAAQNFANCTRFFTDRLLSFLPTIESRIANSHLLQKTYEAVRKDFDSVNYLAICSAQTAWDFMEWSGMVPKQSLHAFEQNLPENCKGQKSVLLLLNQPLMHLNEAIEDLDKKSLQL